MSTWPEAAREVTPEESAVVYGIRPHLIAPEPDREQLMKELVPPMTGEHFRKTYGLWLETDS